MKKKIFILLMLIIILLAAACGRGGNENGEETGGDADIVRVLPDGDIITVSVGLWQESRLSTAANALIDYMAEHGREVSIEFITYAFDEREEHYTKMVSQLAAGMGPDIIMVPNHMMWSLIQNGLLTDLNGFIYDRSNFRENVLYANEINGRLYAMPMGFRFDFVGINSKVPQSFLDRFAALSYVTIMDISDIYHDLIYEYPEFAGYNIIRNLWPANTDVWPVNDIFLEIGQNINFNERTASFGHLNDFITNLTHIFQHNDRIDLPLVLPITVETEKILAEHYIFSLERQPINAMFPFSQPSFVYFTPRADMQGRLITSSEQSFSISNTAPPIAWLFLERLIFDDSFFREIPIMRYNITDGMELSLNVMLQTHGTRPFVGDRFINIQNILNRLEVYAKRPIAPMVSRIMPYNAHERIHDLLELEEFITAWLNEVPVIKAYTTEPDIILEDLMPKTLTIRASIDYRGVIDQATNMLNESLRERGYILSINFEMLAVDSPAMDTGGWSITGAERFITELMAGLGPDLFLNEQFRHRLYPFAGSGFLMNFYDLMDNCEVTSRDDFFVNVLRANETMGGLFELPTMFHFRFIGINDNMPDSILQRFTQLSYIKVSDLFNLYVDYLDNYDDFFYFGAISRISPAELNIMNYIDFSTNTVSFDSGFVESSVGLGMTIHFPARRALPGSPISSTAAIRTLAGTDMFFEQRHNLAQADVFLRRDIPFSHFIPLANDYGSLVIGFDTPFMDSIPRIWMPTAGNVSLAWEFTRYLLAAFADPVGRAAVNSAGWTAPWGRGSFDMPIMRSMFESNIRDTFDSLYSVVGFPLDAFPQGEAFDIAVDNAVERLYRYTDMPMVLSNPYHLLPAELVFAHLDYFRRGLITAGETAARMRNFLTLWFMEM